MSRLTSRVFRWAAIVAALACAYAMGAATGGTPRPAPARQGRPLLDDAAGKMADDVAGQVPRRALERAAIDGMLRRIGDRWARFYTAEQFGGLQSTLNGYYSGVGLWLDAMGKDTRIAGVQPGSPAGRAGVRAGDMVSSVDGTPTRDLTVAAVAAALRGRPDTGVALVVRRGARTVRFELVRAAMASHDVSVSLAADRVLVVRVAAFTRGVGREVRGAVTGHSDRHSGGVVLDLRGNPGGLLDEAVETASVFLAGGTVVTYERGGARPERLDAEAGGDTVTPLVVLVDGGTASAAEVVAGSLRDRDRAVIVGSRTFGKGSVQEPLRLADGSAIELTIGRYRTPSGRSLDGSGIDPDVAVNADRPPREAERRALTVLRGLLATLPTKDRG
jgi:carboxyl-terminal processing protease